MGRAVGGVRVGGSVGASVGLTVGATVGLTVGTAVGAGVAGSGVGAGASDGTSVGIGLGSTVGGVLTSGATSEIRSGTGVPFGVIFASSGRCGALRATCGRAGRFRFGGVTNGGTIVGIGSGATLRTAVEATVCTGAGVGSGLRCDAIVSRLTAIASSGTGSCEPITGENERKMKNKPIAIWTQIESA